MTIDTIKTVYAQLSRWAFPLALVLFIVSLMTCNEEQDAQAELAERLRVQEEQTEQLRNSRDRLVAENAAILIEAKDARALKALTDTVFNLRSREARLIKSVSSYTKITQEGKFKNKTAPFKDSAPAVPGSARPNGPAPGDDIADATAQDTNFIRVPRPFEYEDSTIAFAGTVTREAVQIDSLSVPNTLHLRTAEKKTGFLRLGRETVVQAYNSNPAIYSPGISTVTVKKRPGFWHRVGKPLLFAAFGVALGSAVNP